MPESMMDPSSYPKYVNVFLKWIYSLLFYTIVDIMNLLLKHNDYSIIVTESINMLFETNFPLIDFSKYWNVTVKTISNLRLSHKETVLGLKTILEETLDHYNIEVVHQDSNTKYIVSLFEQLNYILKILKAVRPKKSKSGN